MNDDKLLVEDIQTVNTDEGDKDSSRTKTKFTKMDAVIADIAKAVSSTARNTRDSSEVEKLMTRVVNTIMSVNALDEYAVGLTVNGTLYRFSDYEVTEGLQRMVNGKKIVLTDVPSAKDFSDRKSYCVTGEPLTPGEMKAAIIKIMKILRVNQSLTQLSRPSIELLADAAQYAVISGCVAKLTQSKIVYLTTKFDDEQDVKIGEWAKMFGSSLFEN